MPPRLPGDTMPSMPDKTLEAAQQPPLAPAVAVPVMVPATTKSVRFVRTFRQYQRNDCCGFPITYADQLIQKGVAVDVQQAFANRAMVRK